MGRLMEDIAAGGDARPTTRLIRARPPRNNLEICPTRCCEDCSAGVLACDNSSHGPAAEEGRMERLLAKWGGDILWRKDVAGSQFSFPRSAGVLACGEMWRAGTPALRVVV